jgi:hypothetical protein
LTIVFCTTEVFAEEPSVSPAHTALTIETNQVDLGTVAPGNTASAKIVVANSSSEPITVHEVRVSCGCLSAKLEVNTILSGDTASLTLRMKTYGVPGIADTQLVWLLGENRSLLAEIPVTVITDEIIRVEAEEITLADGRLLADVSLTSTDGLSFIVEPHNGLVRFSSDPDIAHPQDSHTYTLTVLPDSEGRFPRTAEFRTTHPNRRTVDVDLYEAYMKQNGLEGHTACSALFQRFRISSMEETIRLGRVPPSGVTVDIPLDNWDRTDPPNEVLACNGLTVMSSEFSFEQTVTARLELVPTNSVNTVIECEIKIRGSTQVRVAQVLGRISSR